MKNKDQLREQVRTNLDSLIQAVNQSLQGKGLSKLEPVLQRIGRGGVLPHWFATLKKNGTLPNLDGKTIGSVVEMLLVAVIETRLFAQEKIILRINPARGVDLPDLNLGVKSPSENYCTSEPFFSAYERLLGSEHDVLVLLTDYQQKKKNPPLKLQLTDWSYLRGSELADKNLCALALKHRDHLIQHNEAWAMQAKNYFGSPYEPILFCVRDPEDYTFNADDIKVEARTGAQRKLIDYRKPVPSVYSSTKVPGNVWEIPRVRYRMPEYLLWLKCAYSFNHRQTLAEIVSVAGSRRRCVRRLEYD